MKNFIVFMCTLMLCVAMPDAVTKSDINVKENWWSMLYPSEGLKSGDVEIKLKVVEMFEGK